MDKNHDELVKNFVHFYHNSINNKNILQLKELFKDFSKYNFEGNIIYGIDNIFNVINSQITTDINYKVNTYDYMSCGDRRLNILINGEITFKIDGVNYINKHFSEYIHLAFGNDKKYWVPAIIIRSL
jgi:hypothetical protein